MVTRPAPARAERRTTEPTTTGALPQGRRRRALASGRGGCWVGGVVGPAGRPLAVLAGSAGLGGAEVLAGLGVLGVLGGVEVLGEVAVLV
jgi:hypothetical protein